jgi:hypothetical protein
MGGEEVTIATCATETEAEMLAELLRGEGIYVALVPLAGGAAALGPTVWRPFALRALARDAEQAKAILASLDHPAEDTEG